MPVKDPDAGMVWSGFNPTPFKAPKHFSETHTPFYFGGSEVPINLTSNLYVPISKNVGGNPKSEPKSKTVRKYGSFAYVK